MILNAILFTAVFATVMLVAVYFVLWLIKNELSMIRSRLRNNPNTALDDKQWLRYGASKGVVAASGAPCSEKE